MAVKVRALGPTLGGASPGFGADPNLHSYFQQAQQATLDRQTAGQFGVTAPGIGSLSGAVQLPTPIRRFLFQAGVNPDGFQQWLNQRNLQGTDYQARVQMGSANLPPVGGLPQLDQQTLQLFGKVQSVLASGQPDATKAQVVRVAFGGTNGQQLAQQYGLWSKAQQNTGASKDVLGAIEHNPVSRAITGAFGNLLSGISSVGALGRELAAVAEGAKGPTGQPVTAADVGHQAAETVKAIPNIFTLGAAGVIAPSVKAQDRAPGWAQIAETATAPLWQRLLVSPAGTGVGALRRSPNHWVRDLGAVAGMGMDVATDPVSYLSLGSGGAGKASVALLGDVAERATIGAKLGLQGAELERVAAGRGPQAAAELDTLLAKAAPDVAQAARDEGMAARVNLTNLGHARGYDAYKTLLSEQTGLNVDKVFPRVVVAGKKADILALQSRGGISFRGGVPFGPRFGVNVKTGTGALRGIRPMGAWFRDPSHTWHNLNPSQVLDQIGETFNYGAGADRRLLHENRGLYNAVMAVDAQRGGVYKQAEPITKAIRQAEESLRHFRRHNDQADLWLYDMIENGQKSRYRAALQVSSNFTPKQKETVFAAADQLHAQVNKAREIAKGYGVDIATLREIADPTNVDGMERYFPHKVKAAIAQKAGIAVAPTTVGPARARAIRQGTNIVGWAGDTEKLQTGSFAEIQDVMTRLWGPEAAATWISDPVKVASTYVNSVTHAAAQSHGYQLLADAGLVVPDVKNLMQASVGGVIGAGDPVRSAWMAPREQADTLAAAHSAIQTQLSGEVSAHLARRVNSLEQAAQMRETLKGLGERASMHDTQIGLLEASVEYKQALTNLARDDYQQAVADARGMYAQVQRNVARSVGPELRNMPEVKDRLRVQLADAKQAHRDTLVSLRQDYERKVAALAASAPQIQQQMLDDVRKLAAQANTGVRPLNVVRDEITATRLRLAQLEGGELAAAQRSPLIERALGKGAAARKQLVARQRTAAVEAGQLGSEIERAQAEIRKISRAGRDPGELQRTLADLTTRRQAALDAASQASQKVMGVSDMLSTAEAAMRVGDMREGQRLAAEAGASFDVGAGLSPRVAEPIARLLRFHAADLAREEKLIVAKAPQIKWTNETAGWTREQLGAFGLVQPDGASRLGSQADRANQIMDAQARQIQAQWRTAVGDTERQFQETLGERKRQMSAALGREENLQERAVQAAALDPRMQALSAAQAQGDTLNMFQAQLDGDVRQLEAWIDNRDEIKKTMALTSAALRTVTDTDQTLKQAAYAAQSLLEQDKAASGEAIDRLMGDSRIFELMAPHVEHAAAVAGKLPFVENGVVMPKDIADVLLRLERPDQNSFQRVLGMFNTKWKRAVLLTSGSVVRRVLGNIYNATVLAGVPPEAFGKAMKALDLWHGAKALDDIADPTIRHYLKLAMQYNIFEGEISAMPIEGAPFQLGRRHPVQRVEEFLQQRALHGEDMARLAQFIHGMDSGMSPATARLYTGRYHFFNTELTQRERAVLRPAYPFYAYLRNNTALQVYTLFHNPGKIALYGYAAQDLSAPTEGVGAPSWVTQQGGFALPWHFGSAQNMLANTMVDTSQLAIPYNLLGLEQTASGAGGLTGASPLSGDLTQSLTPAAGAGYGLITGHRLGGDALSKQQASTWLRPLLLAMHVVDDQGRINPRATIVADQLLPLLGNVSRLGGGLTASQEEQRTAQLWTKLLGPQIVSNTPRYQAAYLKGQGQAVDQLVPAGQRPTGQQATQQARLAALLQQLGYQGG